VTHSISLAKQGKYREADKRHGSGKTDNHITQMPHYRFCFMSFLKSVYRFGFGFVDQMDEIFQINLMTVDSFFFLLHTS
jgi:hypothetical protein